MPHFVLVEPAVPENVGAAARALKTMGFSSLWIVNSQSHRAKPAQILAHGSRDILDSVREFPDLAAVRAEVDLLIGTSAKPRHQRDILLTPPQLRQHLQQGQLAPDSVALVFGREESGLHRHEVEQCDLLTAIPLAVSYPSLNLAQAVMLYAYSLCDLTPPVPQPRLQTDAAGQYAALREKCRQLLQQVGYQPDEKLPRWLLERLPLLDARSQGFAHHLLDKLRLWGEGGHSPTDKTTGYTAHFGQRGNENDTENDNENDTE